ncbi:hypothetical protein [Streptomyces sp. NPDC051662]|uniref:hypothetical protein n=1 Tax=Streptomyces sp. NPDC051662 TaxID=3154750 RepID=UPI0034131ABA
MKTPATCSPSAPCRRTGHRHSPGTGEPDFDAIREALADADYRGLPGREVIGDRYPYRAVAVAVALDFVRRHPVPVYAE